MQEVGNRIWSTALSLDPPSCSPPIPFSLPALPLPAPIPPFFHHSCLLLTYLHQQVLVGQPHHVLEGFSFCASIPSSVLPSNWHWLLYGSQCLWKRHCNAIGPGRIGLLERPLHHKIKSQHIKAYLVWYFFMWNIKESSPLRGLYN